MDKREAAAALRESVRVNGKAQAGSDDDSDLEGDKPPAPIKVRDGAVVYGMAWYTIKRAMEGPGTGRSVFFREVFGLPWGYVYVGTWEVLLSLVFWLRC